MRIVLTGSSGFIGSKLIIALEKKQHTIIRVDLDEGYDIRKWETVKKIKNFDVLIHLAAISYVPLSYEIPREMYETNINGTLNILELCRLNKAKMIFASSYVYGKPQYLPIDEKHPTVAFNPYCQSKLIGEQLCKSYHQDFGVPVIIFRPFNIYGLGQNENFLIPLIYKQIMGKRKVVLKDPCPRRDFVHVNDVVYAYQKAIVYNKTNFEIFNIGSGKSYSVEEIAKLLISNSAKEIDLEFSNEIRENEVLDTIADISKIEKVLHWLPNITFESGIKEIMENFKL